MSGEKQKDTIEMKLDELHIPMPDEGFESRLFESVSTQSRDVQPANDTRIGGMIEGQKRQLLYYGGALAAMLVLAVSVNVAEITKTDPMIGNIHMLADVEYMEEEQLFVGLDEVVYSLR